MSIRRPRYRRGDYRVWTFSLRRNDLLSGEIDADDDVNIWLIGGEREFNAFKSGNEFLTVGEGSGTRVKKFNFSFGVDVSDTYYFVVSNEHSILTPKTVTVYVAVSDDVLSR
ncbi:MAG: hypothetical protein O3A46_09935 [Candidatus Poribacteria bacterium]|nr:hypothetical protein [Candidatus Poribacteria bacterium]